jgi:predicted amidohydrolase YtcJ
MCYILPKLTTALLMTSIVTEAARAAAAGVPADVLILNGSVHTMDPAQPRAEAVAIIGEHIAAAGSVSDLRALAGPNTRVLDAKQHSVLPGFNDAHVHFLTGGFSLSNVNLRQAGSPEEMARLLAEYARGVGKGRWIVGGNWDHERWPGAQLPSRQLLDGVTPEHPVFVNRLDGHMALANSLALKLAGITIETPDPPGGLIVREQTTGQPTGIFKDAAMGLVERVIPTPTFEEKHRVAMAATQYAARMGVTSVTDMSADADMGLYQYMLEHGELHTRIYAIRTIVSWDALAATGVRAAFGSTMLRIGGLKGFADGSLGSSTAFFFEPYLDNPKNRGLLFEQMLPEGEMLKRVEGADKAGLQVMIHAIGDEANLRILDIYRQVAQTNGQRDRRFRIEHAQHLRDSELPRFAQQKVIASMQPYHEADDGRWCEKRIGPERAKGTYAFRSLLDSGAMLAFGSDWPVAPLNPLEGIQAAVTRQTLDGKHPNGWHPEQKISLDEAIRAYTAGSAWAEFAEKVKGTISPGMQADLVLLDRDIYQGSAMEINKAQIVLTILAGKVVYGKP